MPDPEEETTEETAEEEQPPEELAVPLALDDPAGPVFIDKIKFRARA